MGEMQGSGSAPVSRFAFTRRNAIYGILSTLVTVVLGFATRTVFVHELGNAYLGVNALMLGILGLLSFMELGIGAALNFSLYKPLAQGDTETVRALARFYRKVYRVIALSVTVVGLLVLPFIPMLAQGADGLGNLRLYYLLFLASSVMSFFAVYKTSIANAEQRNYLVTNIHTIASLVVQTAQIAVLLLGGSFLTFLVIMLAGRIAEQLFLNIYFSRRYSDYLQPPESPLSDEQLEPIKQNVKALIWHKIGEVAVHQTDSIIIAAFVNVTVLGMVSNYNLVITSITMFLTVILTSAIGSFGHAIATSTPEHIHRLFNVYRLAVFWIHGVAAIGMYTLLTPFVTLWIGRESVIDDWVVLVILANFYLMGHRAAIITVKSAAGVWVQDKYLPLAQAVINLVLSIVLVQWVGLIGVFIGTLVQGLVANVVRPLIVYPHIFNTSARSYFTDGARYLGALVLGAALPVYLFNGGIVSTATWTSFAVAVLGVFLWVNLVFYAALRRRDETRELIARLRRKAVTP